MPPVQTRTAQQTFREVVASYRRNYGVLADHLAEFLAVRDGSKRATQLSLHPHHDPERECRIVERLCASAGLHWTRYLRGGQHKVIIARAPVGPPPDGEDDNQHNWFSYPSCCVKRFEADPRPYYFLRHTGELLAQGATFAFGVNPFLVSTPLHVLSHYPCSLACAETLAIAEHRLASIRRRAPKLYDDIVRWNRAPGLFTDVCGIAIFFCGARSGQRIDYTDVWHVGIPRELARLSPRHTEEDFVLFDAIDGALQGGDAVELGQGGLTVYSGSAVHGRFARPDHLSWKLVEFV